MYRAESMKSNDLNFGNTGKKVLIGLDVAIGVSISARSCLILSGTGLD